MRKRENRLVVAFDRTTDAMAMEEYCEKNGIDGRLIPIPRVISAGCGLAFTTKLPENEVVEIIKQAEIKEWEIHHCVI